MAVLKDGIGKRDFSAGDGIPSLTQPNTLKRVVRRARLGWGWNLTQAAALKRAVRRARLGWGWNPPPDTAKHAEARYGGEPASAGDGIPSLTQANTLKRVTSASPPRRANPEFHSGAGQTALKRVVRRARLGWGWNPQPDTAKHAEARYGGEPASAGDGI